MKADGSEMWTGNEALDKLRSRAAASSTGTIRISIEELNEVLPIKAAITERNTALEAENAVKDEALRKIVDSVTEEGMDYEGRPPGDGLAPDVAYRCLEIAKAALSPPTGKVLVVDREKLVEIQTMLTDIVVKTERCDVSAVLHKLTALLND